MFYRFHEQLEQRFALEENLNQSSHEGSNTWIQASNNWNPYDELFQMRNQVQQLFNDSISRFNKNSTAHSFTQMPAIDLKDEQGRYVVTADVPGANESSLNVALKDRQLSISMPPLPRRKIWAKRNTCLPTKATSITGSVARWTSRARSTGRANIGSPPRASRAIFRK